MTIALAVLAIVQGIFTLLESIRSARHIRTFRPKPRLTPERVAVFCPCKGTDPEFEKNIRSILDQDYSNYEAHFSVESSNDSAYTVLRSLGVTNIVVAGRATDRGQKVHNLAHDPIGHAQTLDVARFGTSGKARLFPTKSVVNGRMTAPRHVVDPQVSHEIVSRVNFVA